MVGHEECIEIIKQKMLDSLVEPEIRYEKFINDWGQNVVDYLTELGYEVSYVNNGDIIDFSIKV